MDNFRKDFNSSSPVNPNFTFHGNKENELSEEMEISDKKRIPKKKILAKRKKTETLDVEQQPHLSKSFSFDSSLTHYDPVKNYLSSRPKYLMFSPDRHREILARQDTVNRIIKSASYDCVMNLSDEELESSVCSVEETSEIDDKSVDSGEDSEDTGEVTDQVVDNVEETEEIIGEFDKDEEFEDENGWSLKVLLKYLVVMVVVILTTLTISSVNSPTPSPVREAIRGCMDLYSKPHSAAGFEFREVFKAIMARNYGYEEWDKKDLVVNGDELVEMQHEQIKDVCGDEVESKDEGSKKEENEKIDVYPDDIWTRKDSEQFQESKTEESKYIEVEENEIEIFGQLQFIDSNQNDINEEDVDGKEDDNNDGLNENEIESVKTVKFDPVFAAFIGISLLIFASSSVLYYSTMQTEISSLVETTTNEVSNKSSSITSFGTTGSVLTDIDQSSGDSRSHGSFTIDTIIVKKQKSKTPESTISKVRRSSRIHNRSITPSL